MSVNVRMTWIHVFHRGGRLWFNCWLCKTRHEQTGRRGFTWWLFQAPSRLRVQEIYEGGVISLLCLGVKQTSVSTGQSGTSMLHWEKTAAVYDLHSCQPPIGSLWTNCPKVYSVLVTEYCLTDFIDASRLIWTVHFISKIVLQMIQSEFDKWQNDTTAESLLLHQNKFPFWTSINCP